MFRAQYLSLSLSPRRISHEDFQIVAAVLVSRTSNANAAFLIGVSIVSSDPSPKFFNLVGCLCESAVNPPYLALRPLVSRGDMLDRLDMLREAVAASGGIQPE
jgi:hypothetical protein